MTLPRRRFLQLTAGAAALAAGTRVAKAQSYPTRPVRIIIGFAAGASGDIAARVLAQSLSQQLGQQFIVENRSGAGSNIATNFVAHAPNDGYTLLQGTVAGARLEHFAPRERGARPADHFGSGAHRIRYLGLVRVA